MEVGADALLGMMLTEELESGASELLKNLNSECLFKLGDLLQALDGDREQLDGAVLGESAYILNDGGGS